MVFRRHTVDTVYTVGPVNFYTFAVGGLNIMFDAGPDAPNVIDYYENTIDISKIDAIFITHCHVDHYGALNSLKEKTAAKIFFPKYDFVRNRHFGEVIDATCGILKENGFEDDAVAKVKHLVRHFEKELPHVENGFIAEEHLGEINAMGVDVVYAPWHSQSDLMYVVGDYVISGDVLLADIVSTPLLSVDLNDFKRRFANFDAFVDTIVKIKSMEDKTFLPGHKDEIKNVEAVIYFQINKFVERARKIGSALTRETIYSLVCNNIENAAADAYALYIKASEMFFLRDYERNKERLRETLSKTFPELLKKIQFS